MFFLARRYLIVPSDYSPDNIPPSRLATLHKQGVNELNADIVIVENGIEIARTMYRDTLANRLDASLPEVTESVRTEKGEVEEVVLGKEKPPSLRFGAPPLHSFLYMKCPWESGLKEDELIEMIEELGWFDEIGRSTSSLVEKEISNMVDNGLLTYNDDKKTWHAGPKRFDSVYDDLKEDGYEIEAGPYPVVRLIRDRAKGSISKRELIELIYNLNYTKTRNATEFWMKHALEQGYIKEISDKLVESYRTIESR